MLFDKLVKKKNVYRLYQCHQSFLITVYAMNAMTRKLTGTSGCEVWERSRFAILS